MEKQRVLAWLPLALRLLLVVALLAIAPVYERAHAMAGAVDAASHMAGHDLSAGHGSGRMPSSDGHEDAGCRILCLGWVEAMAPERSPGQVTEITLALAPAAAPLRDGIAPDPFFHPPKSASFVRDRAATAA
jgi:hypothetical protein